MTPDDRWAELLACFLAWGYVRRPAGRDGPGEWAVVFVLPHARELPSLRASLVWAGYPPGEEVRRRGVRALRLSGRDVVEAMEELWAAREHFAWRLGRAGG
jgi:hypothetical protein